MEKNEEAFKGSDKGHLLMFGVDMRPELCVCVSDSRWGVDGRGKSKGRRLWPEVCFTG